MEGLWPSIFVLQATSLSGDMMQTVRNVGGKAVMTELTLGDLVSVPAFGDVVSVLSSGKTEGGFISLENVVRTTSPVYSRELNAEAKEGFHDTADASYSGIADVGLYPRRRQLHSHRDEVRVTPHG